MVTTPSSRPSPPAPSSTDRTPPPSELEPATATDPTQPASDATRARRPRGRRPRIPRREWLLAAGLLLLALVPSLAGAMRLEGLASGAPATPETARFVAMPVPIAIHIVSVLIYSLLGIFQFLPTMRRRHLGVHRALGRYLLVPAGFAVALSGLWMTATYQFPAIDGLGLLISRYVVGAAMALALVLALIAIGRRDVPTHAAWMIRAYALAMGAGTQVLTSGPPLLLFGAPDELGRLLQMDAGWLLNVVVAELVIARYVRPRRGDAHGSRKRRGPRTRAAQGVPSGTGG